MQSSRQTIISSAIGVAFLLLMGAIAWIWFSGNSTGDSTETIVVPDAAPIAPPSTSPISEIVENDPILAKLPLSNERGAGADLTRLPPEPPLADNQILAPLVEGVCIARDHPDKTTTHELFTRGAENTSLMKFDLSRVTALPTKATLKACVYWMENVHYRQTPARLIFYRVTTDWDDSATWRFASARDQIRWKNGDFDSRSPHDLDLVPVATVDVPNPPPGGFNVQVDLTSVVAGWVKKEYPNYGLVVSNHSGGGFTYQANLVTRQRNRALCPRILCTFPTRPPPSRSSRTAGHLRCSLIQMRDPKHSTPDPGPLIRRRG